MTKKLTRAAQKRLEQLEAHERLMNLVAAQEQAQHGIVPCLQRDQSRLWTSNHSRDLSAAAALCATCPVIQACRDYATAHKESGGVWGGQKRGYDTGDQTVLPIGEKQ